MSSNYSPTQIRRIEQYKDRWTSFGASTGIVDLSEKLSPAELKRYDLFKPYDDKFLERISADISLATWKPGAVLFEEGSYLDLAFCVVKGSVKILVEAHQPAKPQGGPIFDMLRTAVNIEKIDPSTPKPKQPAAKAAVSTPETPPVSQTVFQTQVNRQYDAGNTIVFLAAMDFDLPYGGEKRLGKGEIFGEIGALVGWPQSVTARTETECQLLQIRVPALRLMKKKSEALKERLDRQYRETSLVSQLKNTPLFRLCEDAFIESLKDRVELTSFRPDELIARESEAANALFLVRSGFVKLTQQMGEGEIVVSYLSKGMTFGEIELLIDEMEGWNYSATSVENTELVKISGDDFIDLVSQYPKARQLLWKTATERIKEMGYTRRRIVKSDFLDTALNVGLVEGNSILVIDLNVCTRCDDCVRGCSETHGGVPRFVREGDKYENFLITRACYHCQDPVCLIGCPTGAIRRAKVGEVVEIEDSLCIGCQTCARNCPYDAITMYETGNQWPDDMIPQPLRGKDQLLATKCDLCYDLDHGPACVGSCPHGCAIRVNNLEEFNQLLFERKI